MGAQESLKDVGRDEIDIPAKPEIKRRGLITHEIRRGEVPSVVTFWGKQLSCAKIGRKLHEMLPDEMLSDPGFETVWRTMESDERKGEKLEMRAIRENLNNLTRGKQPALLSLGCGSPIGNNYGEKIADMMGWNCEVWETSLACNSGAYALKRTFEFDGPVVTLALEGMSRSCRGLLDLAIADYYSLWAFGNGMASMMYYPGKNLKLIHGIEVFEEDTAGHLAANPAYDIDPNGPLIQRFKNDRIIRTRMPKTRGNRLLDIKDLWGTTKMFRRLGMTMAKDFFAGFKNDKPIKRVAAHHPGAKVFEMVVKDLEKYGVTPEMCPWVIPEGNLSSAGTLTAFCRLMSHGRFLVDSYGGGISGVTMAIDVE